jgi:tRNA(fMet)-specific endonuclease VapC
MPASGDVLLDTSVVIPYFKGDAALRQKILTASALYLPQPVLGELLCGAHLSSDAPRTTAEIQSFLSAVLLLSPGATAEHYGRIRAQLARAGIPIPENDIWIAALPIEHQMPLATRNAHFDRIIGLQVLNW